MAAAAPRVETIQCRITSIRRDKRGDEIAFAKTNDGCDVFIGNRLLYLANKMQGDNVHVEAVYDPGRRSYKAIDLPASTTKKWASWQLQAEYPDTAVGEDTGLTFVCWSCGAEVLTPADISHLHGGAVWTRHVVDSIETYGKPAFNQQKQTELINARCVECQHKLGAFYEERYDSCEDDREFPCFKLVCARRRFEDRAMRYGLVLSDNSQDALQALKRTHDGPAFATRVGIHDFDAAEQMRRLNIRD